MKYNAKYADAKKLVKLNNAKVSFFNGLNNISLKFNNDYTLSYTDLSGKPAATLSAGQSYYAVATAKSANYMNSFSSEYNTGDKVMTVLPARQAGITVKNYKKSITAAGQTVSAADFMNGATITGSNRKVTIAAADCVCTLVSSAKTELHDNATADAGKYYICVSPNTVSAAAAYAPVYLKVTLAGTRLNAKKDFELSQKSSDFSGSSNKPFTFMSKGSISFDCVSDDNVDSGDVNVLITYPTGGKIICYGGKNNKSISFDTCFLRAGVYKITVTGLGKYAGSSVTYIYTVRAIKVKSLSADIVPTNKANAKYAKVKVKTADGFELTEGWDYTCTRTVKKDNLTVTVKGTGKAFSGTIRKTITLN